MNLQYFSQLCRDIYNDDILDTGYHHYYIESENIIIIAGTNSLDDWFRYNFRILPLKPFHRGFTVYVERLYTFYLPYVNKDTTIIGHSAGGYMAFQLASLFKCNSVSIGSPIIHHRYQPPTRCNSTHLFITNEYDPIGRIRVGKAEYPMIRYIRWNEVGHRMRNYRINRGESQVILNYVTQIKLDAVNRSSYNGCIPNQKG